MQSATAWSASAAALDTAEWPGLRGGPTARGSARWEAPPAAAALQEWHYAGRTERRYQPGLAVWASPAVVVVEGRPMAFLGGCDQTMHALDLSARRQVWFRITNGEIQAEPAIGRVAGRQVVFWGSADRTVYAHFANDGTRLWTRELVVPTSTMGTAQLSAPLLHGNTLYINGFFHDKALARNRQTGRLFALDLATGAIRWSHELSHGPVSSPVGATIDGKFTIFVAARKGLLQAIDVSGEQPQLRWRFQMPHEVLGSPALDEHSPDPLLLLGSKYGNLIAIDARTGTERWQRMAGNWIDNTVAVGEVDGQAVVFAGSHDYHLYAFRAADGEELWRRRLGGEIYSAPTFFYLGDQPQILAGALDDRLYLADAATGVVSAAFRVGKPIWDLLGKGEVLWGSPVVLEAGDRPVIVHGSYNGLVYLLPLVGKCDMRVPAQSPSSLWRTMGIILLIFLGAILPATLWLPLKPPNQPSPRSE